MEWDKALSRVCKAVSLKLRIEEFFIKDVISHFLQASKQAMRSAEMPAVKWPRFGTFRVSSNLIRKRLRSRINQVRKGYIDRSRAVKDFLAYNQVRRRVREERMERSPRYKKAIEWRRNQELSTGQ